MGDCELPEEFPRLVSIDLEFHAKLVELADMPRLCELWSSLSGQIGALYIRGVEEMNLRSSDLEALHRKLLTAILAGPAAGQLAIIQHYVRDDGSTSTPGIAAQNILNVVSMRLAAEPTRARGGMED